MWHMVERRESYFLCPVLGQDVVGGGRAGKLSPIILSTPSLPQRFISKQPAREAPYPNPPLWKCPGSLEYLVSRSYLATREVGCAIF